MRAIVFATGETAIKALTEHMPAPLVPLLDRPFLQHVLEHLVDHGADSFDFVLGEQPEQIEKHCGDGKRWGCKIRYYLARDAASPYAALRGIEPEDGLIFLAHGDTLPLLPEDLAETQDEVAIEDGHGGWTGWARVRGARMAEMAGARTRAEAEQIIRGSGSRVLPVPVTLRMDGYQSFLQANRMLLEGRFPIPLLTGRQAKERIWISRNVSLHPSARLEAPVFIGENCRISQGAHIGPGAVLGRDSVVDRQSMVRDAVVLPRSYIGEGLDITESIVDGDRLINVSVDAELTVGEDFLLGRIARSKGRLAGRTTGRIGAAVLLALLWPVLLATIVWLALFRRGPVFGARSAVRIPARRDPERWDTASILTLAREPVESGAVHFLLCFLPGLISVVLGRVALVGVEARSREQIEALPADWRGLYLRAKAGLVTEAFVQHGASPAADDQFACEAFYAVSAGPRLDAAILARYAARICGLSARKVHLGTSSRGGES